MILSHIELSAPVELSPDKVNVLVVEPEDKFFSYAEELVALSNGGDGLFALFDGDKKLSFKKDVKLTENIFDIPFNDKKAQSFLIGELNGIAEGDLAAEYSALTQNIFSFLAKLSGQSSFPIEFEEDAGLQPLLKAFGIRWQEIYENLLERLSSMIKFYSSVFGIKCFIFINLRCFLSKEKLALFYKEAELEDVSLFLLENTLKDKIDGEKITLIDKDLCEILV